MYNRLRRKIRFLRNINRIKSSSLFDKDYYLSNHSIDGHVTNAEMHYYVLGWKKGFNPSKNFNNDAYLNDYHDVELANENPLIHYINHGRREGRNIKPVREQVLGQLGYTESDKIAIDNISDFGTRKLLPTNRNFSCACHATPIFCRNSYRDSYVDLKKSDVDIKHYSEFGIKEGRYRSLTKRFLYYQNQFNGKFISAIRDTQSSEFIEFIHDHVKEVDLAYFVSYWLDLCSVKKKVISFDIFDTLIFRKVTHPHDIFRIVELEEKVNGFSSLRIKSRRRVQKTVWGITIFARRYIYADRIRRGYKTSPERE
ncbi:glycosyltransferase [Vibrio variabilis]|uniref:Glycosyltransferase n=1 Tax=Vibrio variabilis TaxID=990271 RepID=A0ABQ0J630_9VIBR|nr:glycosyltransferase [Vibrio variabilis]